MHCLLMGPFLHLQSQGAYARPSPQAVFCCWSPSLTTAGKGSLLLRGHVIRGSPTQVFQDNSLTSWVKSLIPSVKSLRQVGP